jgi:hypothetical protein
MASVLLGIPGVGGLAQMRALLERERQTDFDRGCVQEIERAALTGLTSANIRAGQGGIREQMQAERYNYTGCWCLTSIIARDLQYDDVSAPNVLINTILFCVFYAFTSSQPHLTAFVVSRTRPVSPVPTVPVPLKMPTSMRLRPRRKVENAETTSTGLVRTISRSS